MTAIRKHVRTNACYEFLKDTEATTKVRFHVVAPVFGPYRTTSTQTPQEAHGFLLQNIQGKGRPRKMSQRLCHGADALDEDALDDPRIVVHPPCFAYPAAHFGLEAVFWR